MFTNKENRQLLLEALNRKYEESIAKEDRVKYYQFSTYSGEVIRYPVAAYAATYGNQWQPTHNIYNWFNQLQQPISYIDVLDYFKKIAKTVQNKPPIFDSTFRSLVQLLVVLSEPLKIETLKDQISDIDDIEYNTYGVTIGVDGKEEASRVVESLEKLGIVVSNVTTKYTGKQLIWVLASSDYQVTLKDLACPDNMQSYWANKAKHVPFKSTSESSENYQRPNFC